MINKLKITGMLGLAAKAGKIVSGANATKEAILKGKIKLLIIAEDASERTKTNFLELAKTRNIPIHIIMNIEELSNAIGKKNKAIVGLIDFNFSKAIIKIIDGGDEF